MGGFVGADSELTAARKGADVVFEPGFQPHHLRTLRTFVVEEGNGTFPITGWEIFPQLTRLAIVTHLINHRLVAIEVVLASFLNDKDVAKALNIAARAASITVQGKGAAQSIPSIEEL